MTMEAKTIMMLQTNTVLSVDLRKIMFEITKTELLLTNILKNSRTTVMEYVDL